MTRSKPKLAQALKLVRQLSPEDQEQLVEEMKLEKLERDIQKGIDEADRGELIDGEKLLEELRQRAENRLSKSQR